MKRTINFLHLIVILISALTTAGCTDPAAVTDQNTFVINHNWLYLNKFKYDFKIDNEKIAYNLYMNLRVTSDYKYSNLFVLITQTRPDKTSTIRRYELKLANKDGEWLGTGSGDLYSYQALFRTAYKFPVKGVYYIEIEQNMRDNPLHNISDVGLRVEKVK